MSEVKNYITPKGAKAISDEIHSLLKNERPKIVETVSWAAGNGDRSENGDYIYGKKRLREIDRRVRFLTKRLDAVQVVDPAQQSSKVIVFGATVTVEDEDGKEKIYKIVGEDETDIKQGKISWRSPIGSALLGKKAGSSVTVRTPKGEIDLEILDFKFVDV